MLYTSSMARYGKSPYIYPLYGLGELPQAFARLSAIHGGTYMLDKPISEIVTDEATGKFTGVTSAGETVKAPIVIGSPDYFGAGQEKEGKQRVVEIGKVVRAICLLKHNIPGTDESDSVQIVIPQNQVNRRNGGYLARSSLRRPALTLTPPPPPPPTRTDIYIASVSSTHNVCEKGYTVAIVSTICETSVPEREIAPGLQLLGPILEKCVERASES
jgi:Rab GDP dissociation inhibitor